jgi:NifU-like protein involved in Fe-S cluster formation
MISARAKEHFIDPMNVGEVSSPDAIGRAGSLKCGAVLLITLKVDEAQRITEARFKAAGC